MSALIDVLMSAPIGVTLLGRLEARHLPVTIDWTPAAGGSSIGSMLVDGEGLSKPDTHFADEVPDGTSPSSVAAAAKEVRTMTVGELLAIAVDAGYRSAGPWSSSANVELMRAYRDVQARAPLAEAVAEKLTGFDDPIRLDSQEWWHTNHGAEGWFAQRRLVDLDANVYENGEYTHQGIWTVTAPPSETHNALASAWELDDGPISRWRLPVRAGARVFEVNEAADWLGFVAEYGRIPTRPNAAWELPGLNSRNRHAELDATSGGRAARNAMSHLVVPTWSRVAGDYDGVRLSWRGWIASEGFISYTANGGVTWLRYWFSERTLWLNDVFGEPEPKSGPNLDAHYSVDVNADDVRRERDRGVLRAILGR